MWKKHLNCSIPNGCHYRNSELHEQGASDENWHDVSDEEIALLVLRYHLDLRRATVIIWDDKKAVARQ